jgi:hypothetical protein
MISLAYKNPLTCTINFAKCTPKPNWWLDAHMFLLSPDGQGTPLHLQPVDSTNDVHEWSENTAELFMTPELWDERGLVVLPYTGLGTPYQVMVTKYRLGVDRPSVGEKLNKVASAEAGTDIFGDVLFVNMKFFCKGMQLPVLLQKVQKIQIEVIKVACFDQNGKTNSRCVWLHPATLETASILPTGQVVIAGFLE